MTSRKVSSDDARAKPRKVSTVLPVLVSFGALLVIAFGAAYFGRDLIAVIGAFLVAD